MRPVPIAEVFHDPPDRLFRLTVISTKAGRLITLSPPKRVLDRGRVREMRASGYSLGEIANEMKLPRSRVARICQDAA